jgi:hypothetical protein
VIEALPTKRKKLSPAILLILVVSCYFFPAQVLLTDQEDKLVTHEELTQKAIYANQSASSLEHLASPADMAHNLASLSTWVDGKKAWNGN